MPINVFFLPMKILWDHLKYVIDILKSSFSLIQNNAIAKQNWSTG